MQGRIIGAGLIGIAAAGAAAVLLAAGSQHGTQPNGAIHNPHAAQPNDAVHNPHGDVAADPMGSMGTMLVNGLAKSPGCFGVHRAALDDGRHAILAWFEDRDAVLAWYTNGIHMIYLGQMPAPDGGWPKPLADAPEGTPIMVVATFGFGGEALNQGRNPFSQLSFELYAPVPGGAQWNGRLAPEGFQIPGMRDHTGG